jgi:hypothetical protein
MGNCTVEVILHRHPVLSDLISSPDGNERDNALIQCRMSDARFIEPGWASHSVLIAGPNLH